MDDLEKIKEKKLEQLQQQNQQLEIEAKLDEVARKILTPEAKARLGNVKLVNRELYMNAIQTLLYMYQQGQIQGKIDEANLKAILEKLRLGKREISITRK